MTASRARAGVLTAGAAAALLVLSACGIRATTVPVDAGPAPSRAVCTAPGTSAAPGTPPPVSATPSPGARLSVGPKVVYLVCSAQVGPVTREGKVEGDPLQAARQLLNELQRQPSGPEERAGFYSVVPGSLEVFGPRKGDPGDTLRLSQQVNDLPPFALGQITCTFSYTLAGGGAVTLGGPGEGPPRRYTCSTQLRTEAEAGSDLGSAV